MKAAVISISLILMLAPSCASLHAQQSVEKDWVREFSPTLPTGLAAAVAIATDKAGNVYVTGRKADTSSFPFRIIYDYVTIKYDNKGEEKWKAVFNGPDNSNDRVEAIAVDDLGNVYVTGESEAPDETTSLITVKYSGDGVEQWVARFNGPGNDDAANAVAVDKMGNVYVTGRSRSIGFLPAADCVTIKYNTIGEEQWVARYNGPGNLQDEGRAITVDAAGNAYVTGGSWGDETSMDYATIKYDADGKEQWVARYNGPESSVDLAIAIAVDSLANVYVTGISVGSATSADFATIKYNGDGIEQWVARFNGTGNLEDEAKDLAVDALGNVYVTGVTNDDSSSGESPKQDFATIKYTTSGQQEWVAIYDGPASNADKAFALDLDGLGNIYVTGQSVSAGASFDYATVKYNSAGAQQWAVRFASPENKDDGARDIVVDGLGNVYVTGDTQKENERTKITTIKYIQQPTTGSSLVSVSAASYRGSPVASEAIIAAFGSNLATVTQGATSTPLPTSLAGTTVSVRDSAGQERLAPLFFVSPTQVNYQIPPGTTNGSAAVTIISGNGTISTGTILVDPVAPGIFSADGSGMGLAGAAVLQVKADGAQIYQRVAQFDPVQNKIVAVPIDLGSEADQVFLILYGTGIRFRSALSAVVAKLGGTEAQVIYAGSHDQFVGLDQVNVRLPRSLIGRGEVEVTLTVDNRVANTVKVSIK
jgi:uncharacterized protein (TIGR03437 family)